VLLTSGHVAKIRENDKLMIEAFSKMKTTRRQWFKITMDEGRYITKILPSDAPIVSGKAMALEPQGPEAYVPTTIPDMATAQKFFREARYNPKDSQCFNRAMVWSYEWWRDHSLKSNKILIFFTRNYIRRYNFEWWFHIAPYVHVMDQGKVVERVMDRKYSRGPIEFRRWTDIFMRNDAECPVITKYSEYADHPYSGECFLMRTHMYTYQPADLQMYDAWGYKKTSFNMDEVRGAYLEAFDEHF
jgi:hypothetical protein